MRFSRKVLHEVRFSRKVLHEVRFSRKVLHEVVVANSDCKKLRNHLSYLDLSRLVYNKL